MCHWIEFGWKDYRFTNSPFVLKMAAKGGHGAIAPTGSMTYKSTLCESLFFSPAARAGTQSLSGIQKKLNGSKYRGFLWTMQYPTKSVCPFRYPEVYRNTYHLASRQEWISSYWFSRLHVRYVRMVGSCNETGTSDCMFTVIGRL